MSGLNIQAPRLKHKQEVLKALKKLRQGYINRKEEAGATGTWQWSRLQNDDGEALKQYYILKKALYLRNDVENYLKEIKNNLPRKVIELIKKAKTELEDFYKPIGKIRNRGLMAEGKKKRQDFALLHFQKYLEEGKKFKFIKKEYLEDKNVFDTNISHKRGIIGRLLQKS